MGRMFNNWDIFIKALGSYDKPYLPISKAMKYSQKLLSTLSTRAGNDWDV